MIDSSPILRNQSGDRWRYLQQQWPLNPDLVFLNHGSFGSTPAVVLAAQRRIQDAMEADPIEFLAPERSLEPKLDHVRQVLANLVKASPNDLAFVSNATEGVNAILRSLKLTAEDEILVTNHGYNACVNAARYAADCSGASVRTAEVPFPIASADEVIEAIDHAIRPATRLLLVDHVTSPTGLIFPVQEIVSLAKSKGVRVLVDGAHAPGMVPVDLTSLQADYYTANHHKWLCGPKVSGFLWVSPEWQHEVRPTVISHAANRSRPNRSRFLAEFDWQGTFDASPLLAVPAAIEFLTSLEEDGLIGLMRTNRAKAIQGRQILLESLGLTMPAPESMLGSLATIVLPQPASASRAHEQLHVTLRQRHCIEVPTFPSPVSSDWLLRISMQAYNDVSQIRILADALQEWFRGR